MAGDNARKDDDEQGGQRQRSGEHHPFATLVDAPRAQHALYERLVVGPEIDAQHRHADDQPQPGRGRIGQRANQSDAHVAAFEQRREVVEPAVGEAGSRQDHRPDDQNHRLDQLGVDRRRKTARNGVRSRQHGEDDDDELQVRLREQQLDDQRGGIQRPGRIEKDVAHDADPGKVVTRPLVEASFEKLGNGKYPRTDIEREQERGEKHHHHDPREVVIEHGHTGMVGVARLADKRRTGNTRGEKRQPHDPPRHRTAGQKIRPGVGTLAVAQPPPDY